MNHHCQPSSHDIRLAQLQLTHAIRHLARAEMVRTGTVYRPAPDAPSTYPELLSVDLSAGILPVWDGASTDGLYLSPDDNYRFRFWHDHGHLVSGLNFTPEQENELQHAHHLPVIADMVGRDSLALHLYHADTVGQTEYNVAHKVFPTDQLAFDVAYVCDRDKALASVF